VSDKPVDEKPAAEVEIRGGDKPSDYIDDEFTPFPWAGSVWPDEDSDGEEDSG
jgi:hypothetical protein